MFALYPLIGDYLDGTAAKGLYDACLVGKEEMKGEVHIYSPGYREDEIEEILGYCDHIIFNFPALSIQSKMFACFTKLDCASILNAQHKLAMKSIIPVRQAHAWARRPIF